MLALAGSTIYWRKQVRAATQQRPKKAPATPVFDKRDMAYFKALGELLGCETKPPLKGGDAARLAAYERIELNKQQALGREAEPATVPARELAFTQPATIALAPAMHVQLPTPFTHYRY